MRPAALAPSVALMVLLVGGAASAAPAVSGAPSGEAGTAYRHERFRGRLELGLGSFWARATTDGANDRTFSGATSSFALFLGGGVGQSCALGGTLSSDAVQGLAARDEGTGPLDVSDVSFQHVMWGPALDCYLSADGGVRFLVALGPSELNVDADSAGSFGSGGDPTPDPSGFGYQLGVGYDAFVGPELSLGIALRLTYANLTVSETGGSATDVAVWIPTLGLSLTLD